MRSKFLAATLAASALALTAYPAAAQSASAETTAVAELGPVPKGRLGDAVVPNSYKLDLTIDPSKPNYSGETQIEVTLAQPSSYIDMHGLDFDMKEASAVVGGKTYHGYWAQLDDTGTARLAFRQPLPAGPVTLQFKYRHAFNDGPIGIFRLKVGDQWFAWSQFESIDARRAFPGFDQPGFKTPFSVTIRTPRGMKAYSNTLETASVDIEDQTRHFFAPTKPLPTYLVAMMVGPFAEAEGSIPASTMRTDPVPLRIVTTPGNAGKTQFALEASQKIVPLLEDYFGVPYPFAKLDQVTSPAFPGAMENAATVLYDENIVIMDDGAPVKQQRNLGMVMAHELGHQWFGDLVTPAWWDDIWLNESFANWVGYHIGDKWRPDLHIWEGALGEGYEAMDTDALIAGRPIRQPIETNGQIDAAFDTITYGKGGHVIAMIAAFMGEDKFRKGVHQHLTAHAYGNATGEDFFSALAGAAGDPRIVTAMKGFVEQQGVPLITVSGGKGKYTVSQSRYTRLGTPAPDTRWTVPLCMSRGAARKCALLDQPSMAFSLPGSGALLPNAGGTGYYRFELPQTDWDALIARADRLKGGEAQAVADSLRASFLAGRATPEQLIALTRKLTQNPDSYAFAEAGPTLGLLDTGDALGDQGTAAYRTLVDRIYAPRLAAMGFDPALGAYEGADPEAAATRNVLVRRLATTAYDPKLRQKLLAAAQAYLGGNASALDAAFMREALAVYVQEGDLARTQDLARRAAASSDPDFRSAALSALPEKASIETARWLLDDFDDSKLRPVERMRLLSGIARQDDTRDFAVSWLDSHYERLSSEIGAFNVALGIPYMLSGFCKAADAERLQTQFAPRLAGTPAELSFARALEQMRDCAALTSARGAQMRAAVIGAK